MPERAHIAAPWPFPEPWRVVPNGAAFEVRDGNNRPLVSIAFADPPPAGGNSLRPASLTRDQAHRFANCVAQLPWLLRR